MTDDAHRGGRRKVRPQDPGRGVGIALHERGAGLAGGTTEYVAAWA